MRTLRRGFIAVIAVILFPLAAWIGCEMFHAHTSDPTGSASTYTEYRARMPQSVAAQIFQRDGLEYYAAFGPVRAPLALPSGAPAYVFDRSGRMIDWTF